MLLTKKSRGIIGKSKNYIFNLVPIKKNFVYCTNLAEGKENSKINKNSSTTDLQDKSFNINLQQDPLDGSKVVFFDFQSTTPLDPRVLDAMMPYMTYQFGNPHSKSHEFGWEAEKAVENARAQVASLINADAKEIIFTSGATESNNTALKGVAEFYKEKKKHILTTQTVSISNQNLQINFLNIFIKIFLLLGA
jgi:glutamate/tyrosine decarboxylase-like PLP-dependent enzyme